MRGALAGRVAMVTGASRGIGAAIAVRLAQAGAQVAAVARTLEPRDDLPGSLAETVATIRDHGGTALAIQGDLSSPDDRQAAIERVVAELGPVSVLVNNAAVSWLAPVDSFPRRRFDLMFQIQVAAPFHLAQLVLPAMKSKREGWILNVSSLAARHPVGPPYGADDFLGTTVYGMCKSALERMSSGLAAETHQDGLVVNSLAPAEVVSTWGTRHHDLVPDDPDRIEYPEEFAAAAFALCTCTASDATGRILLTPEVLDRLAPAVLAADGSPFARPVGAS